MPPPAPVLPAIMSAYQAFCTPTGTCSDFDSDLCVPDCTIGAQTLNQLVSDGAVRCVKSLAFQWSPSPGATSYLAYAKEFEQTQLYAQQPQSTVFGRSDVTSPSGAPQRLFTAVVRGVDACGRRGPASVGMIAVSQDCF
jgi:hypothetical protein